MQPLGKASCCKRCGTDNNAISAAKPYHLPPGTVLCRRYVVGKVLGEGGFGITYIGIDQVLSKRVAVKEYYPSGIARRDNSVSADVTVSSDMTKWFEKGVERFLLEAKIAAAFSDEDGIVNVQDYFQQNRTAYIVMDYLDGENLKEYVKNNGTMSFNTLIGLLVPVMRALKDMHAKGMIHRDVSPDNIMLTKKGTLKLTDFGSAKYYTSDERQKAIILKPGYAPEEQYRSNSEQGPFTDVYSLCATIYTCITGKVPLAGPERVKNDTLKTPSQLGADIRPSQEKALMRGMAVLAENRTPDMDTLFRELTGRSFPLGQPKRETVKKREVRKEPPASPNEYPDARKKTGDISKLPTKGYKKGDAKMRRFPIPMILAVVIPTVAVLALVVCLVFFAGKFPKKADPSSQPQVSESSLNISELLSGIDSRPSIPPTTQSSTTVPNTTSPIRPLTLTQAQTHVDELKSFFFDNVIYNDSEARYGNTFELRRIYFCENKNDPMSKYVAFVYRNENGNYYRVMYIDASCFSLSDGKLVSSTTLMTPCLTASNQSDAAKNCWFLEDTYRDQFTKTFIL